MKKWNDWVSREEFPRLFAPSLSNFASALVQSAFYGGYFLIAIPASLVIKKTSYKVAILIGLTLYIGGCTLFFPASHMATYTMFLAAIFAIARERKISFRVWRRLVLNSLSAKVSWWLMMSLWDALRMNMMISYQELVRTFPRKVTGDVLITPELKSDFQGMFTPYLKPGR